MKRRPAATLPGISMGRGRDGGLYTVEVFLISGPMAGKFVRKNRVVSRTIQIRGDQTLEDLHYAIFGAFDREDEHLYEYQIGGKEPMDPKALRYMPSMGMDNPFFDDRPAGDASCTAIGSLPLKVGDPFGYWFDFGDDWWHQINVIAIEQVVPRGRYPKVVKRVGESPPQYMD
ncbi:MAG: plasmid pRiA4b ORF-3 family protein [Nitrospirae bacterium]|nr:plasmid pRiA4b ORF-3 family protein [Nitrospirota bacterium]MBI3606321.1 plasmid pRiA4b ORF-3 family protein [Nitrospirota bacterium]